MLESMQTPFKGRVIPFHFLTYSSRNLEHFKAIQAIRQLVTTRPVVFDREFYYREPLHGLVEAGGA